MTEKEKAHAGYLYDANYNQELLLERSRCSDLCFELNSCRPSDNEKRHSIIKQIMGSISGAYTITSPFWCDLGYNIQLGANFYANYNCTILDEAKITFGDNVFIAPNCCFSTAGHPLDFQQRNMGLEIALPITICDNVWIGAGVIVLPGVTIGKNSVIGAGSVVTKDIPADVIAVGNPCRPLRNITQSDALKYKRFS